MQKFTSGWCVMEQQGWAHICADSNFNLSVGNLASGMALPEGVFNHRNIVLKMQGSITLSLKTIVRNYVLLVLIPGGGALPFWVILGMCGQNGLIFEAQEPADGS